GGRGPMAAAGGGSRAGRITVTLAPAGVRKSGPGLDLPIAIGILSAAGRVDAAAIADLGLVGELALDGRLRPVRGALALALAVRDAGCARLVLPGPSAGEAALAPGLDVYTADDLSSLLRALRGEEGLTRVIGARS